MKLLFHRISYLQYPLMITGLFFALRPHIIGYEHLWSSINSALIFLGLGVSFSTLQDTTKTQNDISKRIWQDPKKGSFVIIIIGFTTAFVILFGLMAYFFIDIKEINEFALGLIVFGIGMISLLKASKEMFENHRSDRKSI